MAASEAAGRGTETPQAAPPDIGRTFGFLVHDVSRLVRARFHRRARQTGLSITRLQAAVILHVARHEGVGQTAVATILDIEPIALVRMLDRLHEEGLIERRTHPTDRRMRTLWLMPGAWTVVERILAITREISDEAFAGLPPGLREALTGALDQVKGNLVHSDDSAGDPDAAPCGKRAAS
jgi:DNA-binding MarR family transcriptional regulator